MPSRGPFRALSLDLWFTTFYHTAEDALGWERARLGTLQRFLVRRKGPALVPDEIANAAQAIGSGLEANWHTPVTTDPAEVLRAIAARLGAEIDGTPGEAARELSAAGLRECPPRPNPEAERLVRSLDQRGIPSVLVTNSARRASTWSEFLRDRGGPPFRAVVSSSDLGFAKPDPTIFREAASRLGVPPSELLHVGDRWELDVVGALAAGCGAVLYLGLADRYPAGEYSALPRPPADTAGVRVVDHLDVLLDPAVWAP